MKEFSSSWKSSRNVGKQRKYVYNAPLSIRQNLVSAHLSKELRKKYGRRSITVRKGDTVMIMRGNFRKKTGNVERVDLKRMRVYVAGTEMQKKDGSKAPYPLQPSNLMITGLNLEDKKRQKSFEAKKKRR